MIVTVPYMGFIKPKSVVPGGFSIGYNAKNITPQTDGTSVSTWSDLSSNAWNASNINVAPTLQNTATHPALSFNGTNTQLQISNSALGITSNIGAVTIVSTFTSNAAATGPVVQITVFGSTNSSRISLQQPYASNGAITMRARRLDTDGGQNTIYAATISTRYVVVGIMDYSNALGSYYVNGVLVVPPTANGLTAGVTQNTNAGIMYIGFDGGANTFNGFIENLYIYNRALTSAEANQAYLALI